MSLTAAMYSARTGLAAVQAQTAGASDNIANALTPGYVARESKLSSKVANGVGFGVYANVVRGSTNSYLLRDVRFEASEMAGLDSRARAIGSIAEATGQPQDERSLAAAFTQLGARFQALFDSPGSVAAQRDVLDAAKSMANTFDRIESAIGDGRLAADGEIADGVAIANNALGEIADLNDRIAIETASGRDPSNLLDERDRQIDRLAEQIGIRTFSRETGEITITTKEGITLLDGSPRQIEFVRASVVPPGATAGAGLSGVFVDGVDITPGSGGGQTTSSGRIAGAVLARDVDLPAYQAQIDELARRTIALFQNADASVTPPASGLFTDAGAYHDATTPADPVPGLAGRLAINTLVDPSVGGELRRLRDGIQAPVGQPGDTTQILSFLDGLGASQTFSASPGLSTSGTLLDYATELSSGHLLDRTRLESSADASQVRLSTLESRRMNENGVNVDEESQRLLELEQAYAANAQVVSAIARMFDDLLANIR